MNPLHTFERALRRHTHTWSSLSWAEKLLLLGGSFLFKRILHKRWTLLNEHLLASSLSPEPQEALILSEIVLKEVGITALKAIRHPRGRRLLGSTQRQRTRWDDLKGSLDSSQIRLCGEQRLRSIFQSPRGLIILSAHLGDFEELIHLSELLDRPVSVVSKRMKSPLAQWLWDQSRQNGPKRLDRQGSGRHLISSLRAGHVVAEVLDQHDPRPRALPISFLGRVAMTSPDVARAALLSDAIIAPIFLYRGEIGSETATRPRYTLVVDHLIDPRAYRDKGLRQATQISLLTRRCVAATERAVRRAPEQWLWLHRRWKAHPDSDHSNDAQLDMQTKLS